VDTEEDTAPWLWDGRAAAAVDIARPWMASSTMGQEGASAAGRTRARNGEGSGWIRDKRARSGRHSAQDGLVWAAPQPTSNIIDRYFEVV
jgi:hypothetical protein